MRLAYAAAFAGLVVSANAHATFQKFWPPGASTGTATCARLPSNNSPIGSTASNVACNNETPAAGKCSVAAGSSVSVEMHQQPGTTSCSDEAIGGNHDGPVLVYMKKVSDASSASGPGGGWFKVAHSGLISASGSTYVWATDNLNSNCGKFTFTVPASIAAGDYLLRAEVIALHVAGSAGGAQHYMTCFQLTVTGGGSASPATVSFPGAYSTNDPGILFNIYGSYTSYPIPGPAVFSGGSTGNPGGGSSQAQPPTSVRPTTTSTSSAVGPTQTPYGQCGGIGWTGPTTCGSGWKCNKQGDYYSQCVPA
ncbi:hypothetical protein FRC02_000395 [Tulasnella sp. 418]|nr:hypothetical protein FRC02_000395 [Tulasnella sp. 418]